MQLVMPKLRPQNTCVFWGSQRQSIKAGWWFPPDHHQPNLRTGWNPPIRIHPSLTKLVELRAVPGRQIPSDRSSARRPAVDVSASFFSAAGGQPAPAGAAGRRPRVRARRRHGEPGQLHPAGRVRRLVLPGHQDRSPHPPQGRHEESM